MNVFYYSRKFSRMLYFSHVLVTDLFIFFVQLDRNSRIFYEFIEFLINTSSWIKIIHVPSQSNDL